MIPSIPSILLPLGLAAVASAQFPAELVGTWTTKSKKVFTGPGFYNPVEDRLIEPELAGISYSFTADGFFESAYYRAVSNPTTPQCPSSIMQWQHGIVSVPGNGSLILEPIGVDGRQLTSSPCSYENSIYTRYNQVELLIRYEVITDPFHNVPRLNLFRFDGSVQQPLYLYYNPPQMLPTQTLNPTTNAPTATARVKRDIHDEGGDGDSTATDSKSQKPLAGWNIIRKPQDLEADHWWWIGIGLVGIGSVMYMLPTSL